MSSLFFYTGSEEAIVATDILATELDGASPRYIREAIPISARRMVIMETGLKPLMT